MRQFMKQNKGLTLWGVMIVLCVMAIMTIGLWLPQTPQPVGPLEALAANGSYTNVKHFKQVFESFNGTAGESIGIGESLAFHKYNGKIYKADANDRDRFPCIGVSGTSAVASGSIKVVTRGILSGMPCGLGTESSNAVTPIGIPLAVAQSPTGGITLYNLAASGVTQIIGISMPLSAQAVASGVTTGTDTYFVDVNKSGVSPYF